MTGPAMSRSKPRWEAARAGASAFAPPAGMSAMRAPLFWRASVADTVVAIDAIPADPDHPDALDIRRTGVAVFLLDRSAAGQRLLLRERGRSIRFDVRSGTLAEGPVRLRYALEGLSRLEPQLLTLRRLAALWRLGRMPAELFPSEPRAARWILALRTIDALADGASQREIAEVLFGRDALADWRGDSDYLRMRVQRLVRSGRELAEHGYLRLLKSRAVRASTRSSW